MNSDLCEIKQFQFVWVEPQIELRAGPFWSSVIAHVCGMVS